MSEPMPAGNQNPPKPPSVEDKMHGNSTPVAATADAGVLKELLEKNLKWSQIIYEQNRKINSKLLWSTIANWARFVILFVPLVLGFLYLPPLIRKYSCLWTGQSCASSTGSAGDLLKLLPLTPQQREQIKAILN